MMTLWLWFPEYISWIMYTVLYCVIVLAISIIFAEFVWYIYSYPTRFYIALLCWLYQLFLLNSCDIFTHILHGFILRYCVGYINCFCWIRVIYLLISYTVLYCVIVLAISIIFAEFVWYIYSYPTGFLYWEWTDPERYAWYRLVYNHNKTTKRAN